MGPAGEPARTPSKSYLAEGEATGEAEAATPLALAGVEGADVQPATARTVTAASKAAIRVIVRFLFDGHPASARGPRDSANTNEAIA